MAYNNNKAGYENILLGVLILTFGFVVFDRLALSFLLCYSNSCVYMEALISGNVFSVKSKSPC